MWFRAQGQDARKGSVQTVAEPSFAGSCLVLGLLLSLASCASLTGRRVGRIDPADIRIDPTECTRITLRDDVPITAQTIDERSVLAGQTMALLQYVELTEGDVTRVDQKKTYANIYLVSKVQVDEGETQTVAYRYLVTDLWRFYPKEGIKVCFQWMIWEEVLGEPATRATLRVLIEDYGGLFVDEHEIVIDDSALAALRAYYEGTREAFWKKVKKEWTGPKELTRMDRP
jgi:hypothetical protein